MKPVIYAKPLWETPENQVSVFTVFEGNTFFEKIVTENQLDFIYKKESILDSGVTHTSISFPATYFVTSENRDLIDLQKSLERNSNVEYIFTVYEPKKGILFYQDETDTPVGQWNYYDPERGVCKLESVSWVQEYTSLYGGCAIACFKLDGQQNLWKIIKI